MSELSSLCRGLRRSLAEASSTKEVAAVKD